MIEAPHYSASGSKHPRAFALPDHTFDGTVNEDVLHQAVKVHLGNQRQGTAKTKTRSFVSGGNQKPWKQKGTGRARQGSTRAPHWRGGGTVFGPIPRDYRADTNRKVRQLARHSALNARAREGMLHVIDAFSIEKPKTSALLGVLARLPLADARTLILTAGSKPAVYLSARNVPDLDVLPFADATAYDIIRADVLVIESTALGDGAAAEATDGAAEPKPARARTRTAKGAAPKRAGKAAGAKSRSTGSTAAKKPKRAKAAGKPKSGSKKASE